MTLAPNECACSRSRWLIGAILLAGCGITGLPLHDHSDSPSDDPRGDASVDPSDAAIEGAGNGGRDAPPLAAGSGSPGGRGGVDAGGRTDGGTDAGASDAGAGSDAAAADGGRRPSNDASVACGGGTVTGDVFAPSRAALERLIGCTVVSGDLVISATDLDDLSELASLETVGGKLQIGDGWNVQPQRPWSLRGLENLRSVRELQIWGTGVTSLEPLANLETAAVINLTHADLLESLVGLGKAQWSLLLLHENASLVSLEGLRAPEAVSEISLADNPKLQSLRPLRGVKRAGDLLAANLPALATLEGLDDLEEIGGTLRIHNLDALTDLSGLGALGQTTSIAANDQLRSLDRQSSAGAPLTVEIADNPVLERIDGATATSGSLAEIAVVNLPALSSLSGLSAVRSVESLMILDCDRLVDLTGLGALTFVRMLSIAQSDRIASLSGLDALEEVLWLQLDWMSALTSIGGMPKLQRASSVVLADVALSDLRGFPPLTRLEALSIYGNSKLTSLAGLENLSDVAEVLLATNALPNLVGLAGLTRVDRLTVTDSAQLATLTGLDALTDVRESLELTENQALTSLRGLSALSRVRAVTITENRMLPQCEVDWLAMRLGGAAPAGLNGPPGMCGP